MTKKIKIVGLFFVALGAGCAALTSPEAQQGVAILETACDSGALALAAEVVEAAAAQGIPAKALAEHLCTLPAVAQAFARRAGRDPVRAAVAEATRVGAL